MMLGANNQIEVHDVIFGDCGNDEWFCIVVGSPDAENLIEAGFEFVDEINDKHLFPFARAVYVRMVLFGFFNLRKSCQNFLNEFIFEVPCFEYVCYFLHEFFFCVFLQFPS